MKTLRNEDGQALVISLLCLTILLGFVGLAADVGTLFYTKRQLQTAADSAALAGASEVNFGLSAITTVANHDAVLNGVTNGTNGFTVTVTNPYTPQNCPATCDPNNYVEVAVSQTQNTLFMSLFSPNPTTVAARAVAFAQNSPGCIFTMNPTASNSLYLNGLLLFLNAPQCAIYVDSNNSANALSAGFIDSIQAKSIGIVGNPGYTPGFFSFINPTPVGGIVPVSDPLAYLNPPATGGCLPSHTNVVANGGQSLSPGNYCGTFFGGVPHAAISVTGPGVSFQPGTYKLNGGSIANAAAPASGGLYISGATAGVTGTGVTFYLYNGASFKISGFGTKLTAPGPAGPFPGILIYQDRSDASPASIGNFLSFVDLEGAVYVPAGSLLFPSAISGTVTNYSIFVVNTLQFQGAFGFFQDYTKASGSGGTSPIKTVVLTE